MTDMTDDPSDMLRGAKEIGSFLRMKTRSVFYYVERGRLPVFRFRSQIWARKSTLQKWIEDQEQRNSTGHRRDHAVDDG